MSSSVFLSDPQIASFVTQMQALFVAQWPQIQYTVAGPYNTWTPLSPMTFANGTSIGSCQTACGSAVVTNIVGLNAITVEPTTSCTAQFFDCGKSAITITFPFTVPSLTADVNVQGFSANTNVSTETVTETVTQVGPLTGSFVVSCPWVPSGSSVQHVELENSKISCAVWPAWTTPTLATVTDGLLHRILIDACTKALSQTSQDIVASLRGSISTFLQNQFATSFSSWNLPSSVDVPGLPYTSPTNATCNSKEAFTIPAMGCNPCDTCCQCFVRQSCSGPCAACECLDCQGIPAQFWIPLTVCIGLITILFLARRFGQSIF